MPSIYDRMTEAQLQTQILHTERGARARVITVIAESKIRRAQILQAGECEREGITQREAAIRREYQKVIVAESKERAQNIKNEGHQKLKQIKNTGHIERELLEQQYHHETAAKIQALERENELRMELMREEHAFKLQLMEKESQARLQRLRGNLPVEETTVMPPCLDMRTVKQPRGRDTSRLATEQREINHKTGEVLKTVIAIDDELAEQVEKIAGGDLSDTDHVSVVLGTAMKMRISEDTSIELRNMYATFNNSNSSRACPWMPARDEHVRELRVSSKSTKAEDHSVTGNDRSLSQVRGSDFSSSTEVSSGAKAREHSRTSKQPGRSTLFTPQLPSSSIYAENAFGSTGLKSSPTTNTYSAGGLYETREPQRSDQTGKSISESNPARIASDNERTSNQKVLDYLSSSTIQSPRSTYKSPEEGSSSIVSQDATIELTDVTLTSGTMVSNDSISSMDYPREVLRKSRERCPRKYTTT